MAGQQQNDTATQSAARRAGCSDQTEAEWDASQALRFRNRLEDDDVREALRLCRAPKPEKCKPAA